VNRISNSRLGNLALALLCSAALSQDLPPGPSVATQATFERAQQTDLVHLVLDFAPGSWTPLHTHGGVGYVTVLSGEMTVRENGEETVYRAGESWVEYPGVFAEVGNASAEGARVLATFLLPKGALLTTVHEAGSSENLPPGPTTVYRSVFENVGLPAAFDVVHLVLDFAPGAWTPLHTHGGEGFVTVLEGAMAVRVEGGAETAYQAGEAWLERPGEFAEVGNAGAEAASIAVTFLLPEGAALTTVR
jgi:quercetin dioxygenase-like cupin family protein